MVKRTETITKVAATPEGTLMTETQVDAIPAFEATIFFTLVHNLTLVASQDISASPSTAKTLLLLTTGSRFDRAATEAIFDSVKSSTAHTKKLPSKEQSRT